MKKSELRQLIKEEIQLLNERTTLKSNIKKELNKEIRKITTPNNKTQYFKDVPLDHIFDILDSFHIIPVQEDNTE